MQHLQLIADPLVNKETNTMRRTITRLPKMNYKTSGTSPYGQLITFDVPNDCNNLSQLFVKVTATTASDNTSNALYAGCWWFKRMTLQTKSGVQLMINTNNYLSVRTDELAQSPVNSMVQEAMQPSPAFNNTTSVFFVPFFGWFSDNTDRTIPTMYTEQLELICEVADSYDEMGFPFDVTGAEYELISEYHDDLVRKPSPLPLSFEVYDVYEEVPVTGPSGLIRTTMTCPNPVFVNHCIVREGPLLTQSITNVKYTVAGEEIVNIPSRIMFSLSSNGETLPTELNMEPNSSTSYYFSRLRGNQARSSKNMDFVNFVDSMYPCVIEVSHDGNTSKKLHNICEYKVIIDIDSNGIVSRRTSNKLNFNKPLPGA
jgi:hypothetical protein